MLVLHIQQHRKGMQKHVKTFNNKYEKQYVAVVVVRYNDTSTTQDNTMRYKTNHKVQIDFRTNYQRHNKPETTGQQINLRLSSSGGKQWATEEAKDCEGLLCVLTGFGKLIPII